MADWGKTLMIIAIILVLLGAINWGLIGLFNKNVIAALNTATFNSTWLLKTIYILVGVAAIYIIFKSSWVKDMF